jgi:hypothetical protein
MRSSCFVEPELQRIEPKLRGLRANAPALLGACNEPLDVEQCTNLVESFLGDRRHIPLRSATAATMAPGSSASDMMRSFSSAGQRRRRSTVEMISAAMCLSVPSSASRSSCSPEGTLTSILSRLQQFAELICTLFDRLVSVQRIGVSH